MLAAASPTHPVSEKIYENVWASGPHFENGEEYDGTKLPLGPEKGGPLFLSQYSFLGIDPRGLKDDHADYFEQNRNHALINRQHCIDNPNGYLGYSAECWGLTACDNPWGYDAHSPTVDKGVIAPTAALSSFPYTPKESMDALRHFDEVLGDRLWGEHGFVDAFSVSEDWFSDGNISIDQGPIVAMIENHRSGMLWDLFMSCPEVKQALSKLGFESPHLSGQAPARDSRPSPKGPKTG